MKDKVIQELIKETWHQTHTSKMDLFLTPEQKHLLRVIGKTHNLSISTIVDIIATQYWMHEYTRQLMQIDTTMYKTYNQPKTCVKLRNMYELKTRQINNAVVIYCQKLDKDPNDSKFHEKIRNKLNHEFQDAIDPWVNYHAYCHMAQRYERENKK